MTRVLIAGLVLVALAAGAGCERGTTADSTPAAAPAGSGKVDPEDPKAGTNTARPDSIKDVQPGADGSKPAGSN